MPRAFVDEGFGGGGDNFCPRSEVPNHQAPEFETVPTVKQKDSYYFSLATSPVLVMAAILPLLLKKFAQFGCAYLKSN